MVKVGKKTTTSAANNKNKENPEIYVLLRNIVTNAHQVVQRSEVTTSKKILKLEPGDEVSYGQRNNRIRALILMIGTINLFLCKH